MRIVWITPGSGESFYCENCLRDFAMLRALRALGHYAQIVPMYLPLSLDRETAGTSPRESGRSGAIFFGGINVYLQQKLSFFRRTPRWLDALWDRAGLLRLAGRLSGMVKADQLKQTLLSMLHGLEGRQAKEVRRLCDHLATEGADVVVLSNALLLGLAGPIRSRLGARVACYLQDEDEFIDALGEADRREIWDTLRQLAAQVDLFLAASDYYAGKMATVLGGAAERGMGVPPMCSTGVSPVSLPFPAVSSFSVQRRNNEDTAGTAVPHMGETPMPHTGKMPVPHMGEMPMPRIATVPGGITMEDYGTPEPREAATSPVIGFLSRRCYSKGPDILAEAFCRLKRDPRLANARLRFAGGLLAPDKPLERQIRRRLAAERIEGDVEFLPHLELPQRVQFLRGLSVLSVPERLGESGGRYVKEALACGVPVVQPHNGCFPELLAATGGGLLFPPGDVDALVARLTRVLTEPGLARTLAAQGRAGVAEHYSAARCAQRLAEQLVQAEEKTL